MTPEKVYHYLLLKFFCIIVKLNSMSLGVWGGGKISVGTVTLTEFKKVIAGISVWQPLKVLR